MLQKVWDHKDVRRILTKYKYKKTDFVMKKNPPSKTKTKESSEGKPNEETNSKETDHLLQGKDEIRSLFRYFCFFIAKPYKNTPICCYST